MRPFVGTIRAYVDTLDPDYTLPLAISAVDSIESRRDIQDALPGAILNASTGPTNVEVSRHGALGEGPCLYCLYLPDVLARSRVQLAMARTGFGQKDVAGLLVPDGHRLTLDNVRGIERHNRLAPGALHAYHGRSLAELLDDHLWYGQTPVKGWRRAWFGRCSRCFASCVADHPVSSWMAPSWRHQACRSPG